MTSFCLIHGAYHGAGCWARLAAELEARGHTVIAVDLPCADTSAGTNRYAETVIEALADAGDDVTLVAHSLGGLTLPLVAERRTVRHAIYLCGLLPLPGKSLRDQMLAQPLGVEGWPAEDSWIAHEDGTYSWKEEPAIEFFYHDCAPDDARWAASLLRPQAQTPIDELTPLRQWPAVDSTYVLCRDDRVVNPDWSRMHVPARLGVRPLELPGGHAPFVSRPAVLADTLTATLGEAR